MAAPWLAFVLAADGSGLLIRIEENGARTVGPILVAIAVPNGAGKTTFYRAHLSNAGLRFVNAGQSSSPAIQPTG